MATEVRPEIKARSFGENIESDLAPKFIRVVENAAMASARTMGRGERELRADYRAAVPLFSAALGQLFTVDSVRAAHLPDRSTVATFAVSMTPDGIQSRFPNFAQYMRKYVETGLRSGNRARDLVTSFSSPCRRLSMSFASGRAFFMASSKSLMARS